MTQEQRNLLFHWISKRLDLNNEECKLFYDRYNPENQYLVKCKLNGVESEYMCFKHTPDRRDITEINSDGGVVELKNHTEECFYLDNGKTINKEYIIGYEKKIEIVN